MVRWTLRCLKGKKGSALILVMAALILLMSISSVVVALSAANVRMSRRFSDWSKEFYWLDFIAEDRLGTFDSEALLPAELLARKYVQEECYKAEEYTDLGGELTVFLPEPLQGIINAQWQAVSEAIDALDKGESLTGEQEEMLDTFPQRAFSIVYAAAVESHLMGGRGQGDRLYPDSGYPAGLDYPIDSSAAVSRRNWLPDGWPSMSFDAIYSGVENGAPSVKIVATEAEGPEPKSVEVNVVLQVPQYDVVSQTRYFVVKPNPLYANALSVQGSVRFAGGDIRIEGDLAAAARDKEGRLQRDSRGLDSTDEGNSLGVLTTAPGTRVTVYGNIYTGGDVHLRASDSAIAVRPARQGNTLKTRLLYGEAGDKDDNPYWFDVGISPEALNYTKEAVGSSRIPYIYEDSAGGNVYCNNLAIEDGVIGGSLLVSGSVWTQDDIQNDGQAGTSITVKGNYIGMSSEAEVGGSKEGTDPNASSAVINNALPYGGTIEIDGLYVIPGTAFYELYSSTRRPEYYQTAESINAKGGEFFKVYLLEDGAGGKTYYVSADPDDDEHYSFFVGDLEAKRRLFENVVSPYMDDYNSNVILNPDAVRYILGVGVTKWGAGGRSAIVKDGGDMSAQYDFYSVKDTVLPAVFKGKTVFFGTNGYGFFDLIDPSAAISDPENGFYVFRGSRTINFDAENIRSGIIYCGGDLTITGGTFRGAIVCAGNVTIQGNTTIVHDESVIRAVLGVTEAWQLMDADTGYSAYARRFFSPGGYAAKTSFGVDAHVVTAAADEDRFTSTRYTIRSWEEINA